MLSQIAATESPERPLLVNAGGVAVFYDHALDALARWLTRPTRPIIFYNTDEQSLVDALGSYDARATHQGVTAFIYGLSNASLSPLAAHIEDAPTLEKEHVEKCVREAFYLFPKPRRLASTPLMANGTFDARLVIADRGPFCWISLNLADRLEDYLNDRWSDVLAHNSDEASEFNSDRGLSESGEVQRPMIQLPRLLAVSLRGSPMAAAVGILSEMEDRLEVVDHVGPKHRILEEHSLRGDSFRGAFILIADFIVGGTELKIARNYAHHRGGVLCHVVTIGTVLPTEDYMTDVSISRLVDLTKVCPEVRYSFLPRLGA
jgi:hypothetical protein